MVKQIIAYQGQTDYIQTLTQNSNCIAGLIIGKTSSNKDYIVRLVRCPPLVEGEENDWHTVTDVDETWVSGHAAQILPSLPGGVEVIGAFVVTCQAESVKDTRVKLKQMLYQSYRSVTKAQKETDELFGEKTVNSIFWTVAHFDAKKGGALSNCYQFDVMDYKDTGRPVEWKQQEASIQWDYLWCNLLLDESINTEDASKTSDVLHQFSMNFCRKIANACIMIDNKQRGGNEVLNLSSIATAKNSKKKKTPHKLSCSDYQCQIFIPIKQEKGSEDFLDCTKIQTVDMKGCITGTAFVPPGTTVEEAVDFLKRDLVISLRHRFQLLREDLAESGDGYFSKMATLPLRYFCCDTSEKQGNRIIYSDYILPGEPHDECIDRISDNLDLEFQENSSDHSIPVEKFPVVEIQTSSDQKTGEAAKDIKQESAKPMYIAGAVCAAAIAAIGWLLSEMDLN